MKKKLIKLIGLSLGAITLASCGNNNVNQNNQGEVATEESKTDNTETKKPTETKSSETKATPSESKPVETPTESKPVETPTESKPVDTSTTQTQTETESTDEYTVSFVTNNGKNLPEIKAKKGEKLEKVEDPIKESKTENNQKIEYKFDGWYLDKEFKTKFNFDEPINGNITLYAKYTENKTEIISQKALDIKGVFSAKKTRESKDTKSISSNTLDNSTNFKCDYSGEENTVTITLPQLFVIIDGENTITAEVNDKGEYVAKVSKIEVGTYSFEVKSDETPAYKACDKFFRMTINEVVVKQGKVTVTPSKDIVYNPAGTDVTFERDVKDGSKFTVTLKDKVVESVLDEKNNRYVVVLTLHDAGEYEYEISSPKEEPFTVEYNYSGKIVIAEAKNDVEVVEVNNFTYDGKSHTMIVATKAEALVKVNNVSIEKKDDVYSYDFIDAGTYHVSIYQHVQNYTEYSKEFDVVVEKANPIVICSVDGKEIDTNTFEMDYADKHEFKVVSDYAFSVSLSDQTYESVETENGFEYTVSLQDLEKYTLRVTSKENSNINTFDTEYVLTQSKDRISLLTTLDDKDELTTKYDGNEHTLYLYSDNATYTAQYGENTYNSENGEIRIAIKDAGEYDFLIKSGTYETHIIATIEKADFTYEIYDYEGKKLDSLKDLAKGSYKVVSPIEFAIGDTKSILEGTSYYINVSVDSTCEIELVSLNNNYNNGIVKFETIAEKVLFDFSDNTEKPAQNKNKEYVLEKETNGSKVTLSTKTAAQMYQTYNKANLQHHGLGTGSGKEKGEIIVKVDTSYKYSKITFVFEAWHNKKGNAAVEINGTATETIVEDGYSFTLTDISADGTYKVSHKSGDNRFYITKVILEA